MPLVELGDKSWLSLYWTPVLVDLHHEHMLAGYFIAYYHIDVSNKRNSTAAEAAAAEAAVAEAARGVSGAAGRGGGRVLPAGRVRQSARGRDTTREGAVCREGEADADTDEDDEPGRREGEAERRGEESKESSPQQNDVAALSRHLNGSLHLHAAEDEYDTEEDDGGGTDDNSAPEGAPQPLETDDAQLLLLGYVGCKVDESTWYGDGGQLEGDELAVTDTFTAHRLSSSVGVESRVTHVDVENELYDMLNSDGLLHPDYLHAVQHTKMR